MQKIHNNKTRIIMGIMLCIVGLLFLDILFNVFTYDNINEMISITFWVIIFPFIFTIVSIIMSIGFFYSSTIENKNALKVNTAVSIIEGIEESDKRLLLYDIVNDVINNNQIDYINRGELIKTFDDDVAYPNVILDLLGYEKFKLSSTNDEQDDDILIS